MSFQGQAERAIMRLLFKKATVRPSDVWPLISAKPKDPRALGSVFKSLHHDGRIQPFSFSICPRKERHGGVERVWLRA